MQSTTVATLPALTVCQPYASLIMLPDDNPEKKRVENRIWRMNYRGPLVIHAGKSTAWLKTYHDPMPEKMPFGAILGIVDVVECFAASEIATSNVPHQYGWLKTHKHTDGPWCIVLSNPRLLAQPIAYKGAQGLWRVKRELVTSLL